MSPVRVPGSGPEPAVQPDRPGPARPAATTVVPGATPPAPEAAEPVAPIKVIATQLGYYGHSRRRKGDVFWIDGPAAFSSVWMERADPDEPERLTRGNQAIREERALKPSARERGVLGPTGDADPLGGDRD